MLKTKLSQQPCWNYFRLTKTLPPLALGVTLITLTGVSVDARPIVVVDPPLPTTQIIGSPIPSPVPLVPGTTTPYSLSPYNSNYNRVIVTPGRRIIQNSTLINPTIINSRINNSVLVDPVIINSPRYPIGSYGGYGYGNYGYGNYGYGGSSFIYNSPGFGIRIGR